jgi:hypothetical protein
MSLLDLESRSVHEVVSLQENCYSFKRRAAVGGRTASRYEMERGTQSNEIMVGIKMCDQKRFLLFLMGKHLR